MSVSLRGGTSGALAEIDAGSLAQRTSLRPIRTLSWNSLAVQSGALTTIAANGRLFSLRNVGANLVLIRRVGLGFMTTTAFTAAQTLDYSMFMVRSFTASDTTGTDVTPTGNIGKHRSSLAQSTIAARMAAAAVISGGTLGSTDTFAMGIVAGGSTGLGTGLSPTPDNMFQQSTGDLPIVLVQNEGIMIQNNTLMGAAGVVKVYVSLEYAEIAVADYA